MGDGTKGNKWKKKKGDRGRGERAARRFSRDFCILRAAARDEIPTVAIDLIFRISDVKRHRERVSRIFFPLRTPENFHTVRSTI